jgi:putative ATP-binding cassette transporter
VKQFNRAFLRDLWRLSKPYWWSSEERWSARGLLAAVIALNLVTVVISYRITQWYSAFWNALQKYDASAAFHQLFVFAVLVTPFLIASVYQIYLTQMLEIRWQRWLTREYLDAWLSSGTYYQMQALGDGTDNPDQRIAEDLRTFTQQTLELLVGLLGSLTTLAAFLSMLWSLSAQAAFSFHGKPVALPGYLVWTAVVYSFFGTVLIAWIGRPLITLDFDQERYQADFRFSLVRLRENSESVALYGGEARERSEFLRRFASIFSNFWQIMRRTKRLNWWASGYGQAAIIFPVLVAMPAYFAKSIGIGVIMQISSAFGQVQNALSFVVNSYTGLASWHAVVDRLRFFDQAMAQVRTTREVHQKLVRRDGPALDLVQVAVSLPGGRVLVRGLDLHLERGERLLIMGPTGSGKSTLIRAMAGIWPYSEGEIRIPLGERMLVLPQRPYLPLGTLRDVLLYPFGDAATDEQLEQLLETAGLQQLRGELGRQYMWSHVLSLGEQQRLALARVLLQQPVWLFMDEATSALDEPAEAELYGAVIDRLPDTAIVSVAHRSSLLTFHERRLLLLGAGRWQQGLALEPTGARIPT